MNTELLIRLEQGNYLSLATRKRSGEWVATPVWFAPHEDSYYLFSAGDAGKVKRLRNFSAARIAPCTVTGRLTGSWINVSAFLVEDEAEAVLALAALRRKYGWQMALTDLLSRLTGKMSKRSYIRVDPLAT
ncbi:PPOX class F420-dependent oxidoreductase [Kineobactrum sediminis]|uniref:PPOX class F420-dependent oxidoreductase n=1 Tax=Kineobactrum sediminis TaxID=1905677 RepID=A0A2N5Y0A6_9GAMM|nr:PPOX class F420-dependent oxidoreductase [Kineobactrum sediminis]PLW81834.1 PPOX class F420-dependent oxidoreductase [Kineobactrum sediminis]